MGAFKALLGVRLSTGNDLCLVELGLTTPRALVKQKQKDFFERMTRERNDMNDDPLIFAMKLTGATSTGS